jgi:hypothetical protein
MERKEGAHFEWAMRLEDFSSARFSPPHSIAMASRSPCARIQRLQPSVVAQVRL